MPMNRNNTDEHEEAAPRIARTRQILIFRLLLNPGSQRSISIKREKRRDKYRRRKTCFVESYLRGKLMARSLAECSSSFFRYHYTEGADAAAASLSVTLREATEEKTLRLIYPPASGMEPEQSSLYRRDIRSHSNPGNRFFPSPLPLCLLFYHFAPFSAVSLCLSLDSQLFSQLGIFAQTILTRSCARARARPDAPKAGTSSKPAAIRSRRERDVGVIVRLNAGKSAECFGRSTTDDWALFSWSSSEVYEQSRFWRGGTTLRVNQIDLHLRTIEDQLISYMSLIFAV